MTTDTYVDRPQCTWGAINREKIEENKRRILDLENKFWTSLFFSFSTLVGILVNILLTMGKH